MTNTFPSRLSFPETHPKLRRSRAEAARINGAKSRGPKTVEGKAVSSKNALREGIIAKRIAPLLNRGDERRDYVLHFQGLKTEFKPQTRSEMNLLELIARDFVLLAQVGQAPIGQFMNRPRKGVERPLETISDLLFEVDVIDQVCSGLESELPFELPADAQTTFVRLVAGNVQVWQKRLSMKDGPPRQINRTGLTNCRWLDIQHVADVVSGKAALAADCREPWSVLLKVLKDDAHRRIRQADLDDQDHEQACRASLDADALPLLERFLDLEGKIQRTLESRIELYLRIRRGRKSL